ncbi:MAG: hypothetical protein ACRCSI_04905, partial [Eubacterium aggregans]
QPHRSGYEKRLIIDLSAPQNSPFPNSLKFNPNINLTVADLSVLDSETISYRIKQSKTDQAKKGHLIYIFNLSSPIQPYQSVFSYLQLRGSQANSPHKPLFIDDSKSSKSTSKAMIPKAPQIRPSTVRHPSKKNTVTLFVLGQQPQQAHQALIR